MTFKIVGGPRTINRPGDKVAETFYLLIRCRKAVGRVFRVGTCRSSVVRERGGRRGGHHEDGSEDADDGKPAANCSVLVRKHIVCRDAMKNDRPELNLYIYVYTCLKRTRLRADPAHDFISITMHAENGNMHVRVLVTFCPMAGGFARREND